MMRGQDEQSRVVFHELCSLILNVIRSPPPPPPPSSMSFSRRNTTTTITLVSPSGFASLLLGISLALMLCGSVTFVIGFILMPWVLGLVMVLHLVGVVSNLSVLGRAFLCPTSQKEAVSAWNFL